MDQKTLFFYRDTAGGLSDLSGDPPPPGPGDLVWCISSLPLILRIPTEGVHLCKGILLPGNETFQKH